VYRANDGVALVSDKHDGPPRVYVPLTGALTDDHRRRVVKHAHEALHHLGTKRTISDIMRTYYPNFHDEVDPKGTASLLLSHFPSI